MEFLNWALSCVLDRYILPDVANQQRVLPKIFILQVFIACFWDSF